MGDLTEGGEMERGLLRAEKSRALFRRRHPLQQGPERMPVHHANAAMSFRTKGQRVHIGAPTQRVASAHIVCVGHDPW